jgi:acetoin utilization deacetylase AcuC-like enzyme
MHSPIFYDSRQNVAGLDSFSPSAGKPARFVRLMGHFNFPEYGTPHLAPVVPVDRRDLCLVHDTAFVDAVFAGTMTNGFNNCDPRVPESCLWTIGSLLAAARWALRNPLGAACSPSSGFHHAGVDFSGGYCTFNGLMVVAAKLINENPSLKIGILDCDMHHGDGTNDILHTHPDLARSIQHHTAGEQFNGENPADEAPLFSIWLNSAIDELNAFGCDLVLYQAGADMHLDDPLGGILDDAGMLLRDQTVFSRIKGGIAWNLAGGYRGGKDIFSDPVLATHYNTLKAAQARGEGSTANEPDRTEVIRARFHKWLEANGFAEQVTPKPGKSYKGSHVQTLWECWLAATQQERNEVYA